MVYHSSSQQQKSNDKYCDKSILGYNKKIECLNLTHSLVMDHISISCYVVFDPRSEQWSDRIIRI